MGEKLTSNRRRFGWVWLMLGWMWLVACLGIAIDFGTNYRSLTEWAGEWQFYWFGRYFPSVTITLGILIAVLPLVLAAWILRWRHGRRATEASVSEDPLVRARRSALRGNRFFGVLSVMLLFSALGALVIASHAPTAEGAVRRVDLAGWAAPVEGHARYAPVPRLGRVARVTENVGFAARTIWVAPVYRTINPDVARPQYWTELLPVEGTDRRFHRLASGILVRGGLPPEVGPLYRGIGIVVPDDAAVLMLDSARPRWRMVAAAVQAAAVSMLALVIALLLRRQANKLRARIERRAHRRKAQALP